MGLEIVLHCLLQGLSYVSSFLPVLPRILSFSHCMPPTSPSLLTHTSLS